MNSYGHDGLILTTTGSFQTTFDTRKQATDMPSTPATQWLITPCFEPLPSQDVAAWKDEVAKS